MNPAGHGALDLAMPVGTDVHPVAPGRVRRIVVNDPNAGTMVELEHGPDWRWRSQYMHLSAINTRVGNMVGYDSIIGESGGAPRAWGAGNSTGPHLHVGILRDGVAQDPLPLIDWMGLRLVDVHGNRLH